MATVHVGANADPHSSIILVPAEGWLFQLKAVGHPVRPCVLTHHGFGREVCARKGAEIQFQNLVSARRRVHDVFADVLSPSDWDHACRVFQKRHLVAHRMGVIDAEYVRQANDGGAVIGRRVAIGPMEVTSGIAIVDALGRRLFDALLAHSP